tara:strand:- start:501 stop:755 length:255 start_codon:yes stop_codon:yes gene_type:complete
MNINTKDFLFFAVLFPWSVVILTILYSIRRVTMAKVNKETGHVSNGEKKTSIGCGKFSKWGHKGGGQNGSTPSKKYRKRPRGQG